MTCVIAATVIKLVISVLDVLQEKLNCRSIEESCFNDAFLKQTLSFLRFATFFRKKNSSLESLTSNIFKTLLDTVFFCRTWRQIIDLEMHMI